MKAYTFTLIILSLISQSVFAYYGENTELTVRHFSQAPVTVVLDQHSYNYPSTALRVERIRPGRHYLKVTVHLEGRHHHHNRRVHRIVYDGFINLERGFVFDAFIDEYNHLHLTPTPLQPDYYGDPQVDNGHHDYYHVQTNGASNFGWDNPSTCEVYTPNYAVDKKEFKEMIRSIRNRNFDSDKERTIVSIVEYNYLTSKQVYKLLRELNFESSKLRIAKVAFHKTVDPEKYYKVNDAFSFSSSVRNLSNYIARN